MRLSALLILLATVTLSFSAFVDVGARVDSGVITVSSIGGEPYVIVTPNNGKILMYNLYDLEKAVPTYAWEMNIIGADKILSTGALAYWSLHFKNYLFVYPYDVGLKMVLFDENSSSPVTLNGNDVVDWGQVVGGIAAFTAYEESDSIYFIVAGVNTEGILHVGLVFLNSSDFESASYEEVTYDLGSEAYSTLAISDVVKGEDGNARIYVGTDRKVLIFDLKWNVTDPNPLTLSMKAAFDIYGKAQSGFAVGNKYVYFMTYSLQRTYFYVLDKEGKNLQMYPVDVPEGESPYSWPTNSPVVMDANGNDKVFFTVGRSVYKFESSSPAEGVQKYADIGEPIVVAPVVAEDWENPGNKVLLVVSISGRVYKVGYMDVEEIPENDCAGKGTVYSPPTIKNGRLLFGMATRSGGALCSINVSEYAEGVTMEGWPEYGYKGGRTQTYMVNPPFNIPLYLRAEFENGESASGKVRFDFITEDMVLSNIPTETHYFNYVLDVRQSVIATACAHEVEGEDIVESINGVDYPGTDVEYRFMRWESGETTACKSGQINDIEVWRAIYAKYYRYKRILVNISGAVEEIVGESTDTFVKKGDTIELSPTSGYEFVKWEIITPDGSLSSTDPTLSYQVNSPVLVKEYVKKIYGVLWFKYPKQIFEPTWSSNTFEIAFQLRFLRPLEYGGKDATGLRSISIELGDVEQLLGISATVVEATWTVSTDAQHVEFNGGGGELGVTMRGVPTKDWLILISSSDLINQATDMLIATLTIEYDGDPSEFPLELDSRMQNAVKAYAGDNMAEGGLLMVLTSNYGHRYGDINPDASGLDYLPEVSLLGDFNGDGCVDFMDLISFVNKYGLRKGDPDWEAKYDIGPRDEFSPPPDYYPGFLKIEPGRPINFEDFRYLATMYGYCK